MHGRGVMHRDIAPANVVLSGDRVPCLVGFALAMSLAEIRPEFMPHSEIVGTLAYLAPEQTGRIGRPVDQRADLYALGATLYELATGEPPFGTGDPLRLTHDHLARVPVPPAEVNRDVPAPLSAIVMHLLEKEPDDRYQTADGVVYDLERLGTPTGEGRLRCESASVMFPAVAAASRLVGREEEVAALHEAFADALAGRCRGVLVRGAPGVGRTALVDELRSVVTGRHGWFVAGKFDQYRRDLEFDAGYQAFRALGRLLLAEPDDDLAAVRERILAAVGPNAGLLSAVAPEFAALLAVAPEPGDPLTAQVRARRTAAQVPAGRRVAPASTGDVPRRPAVGGARAARLCRPRAQRRAGRRPAARGRLPRRRCGRGASAGALAGPGRRAAASAGQPAPDQPRNDGCRDAACGIGCRGRSGRGDQPAYARKSRTRPCELPDALRRDGC